MSTTTVHLDDELKTRLTLAAERAGKSTHAYIVEAIEQAVEAAELSDEVHRVAGARWNRLLATARSVPFAEAKAYLDARARGEQPRKPAAKLIKR